MEVLEGFGTGINRRRFLHSTVSGVAIGIAEGAVTSEPFSAANREEFREFSLPWLAVLTATLQLTRISDSLTLFGVFAKQGINREISACNLRILYHLSLQ